MQIGRIQLTILDKWQLMWRVICRPYCFNTVNKYQPLSCMFRFYSNSQPHGISQNSESAFWSESWLWVYHWANCLFHFIRTNKNRNMHFNTSYLRRSLWTIHIKCCLERAESTFLSQSSYKRMTFPRFFNACRFKHYTRAVNSSFNGKFQRRLILNLLWIKIAEVS